MHALLNWYLDNPRDYPWRKNPQPYTTWLSEIILQQTRIAQGMPYYKSFLENYPTIEHLAKASEQEVMKHWQGLGYYSRARNLHATAKYIFFEKLGVFPDTFSELIRLKGVGPYTAAAIASICFDERVPAMDGNAYRVYARWLGYARSIDSPKARRELFDLAKAQLPPKRAGDFNQAIMDLGAHVCTPKNPNCELCPLHSNCRAFRDGTTTQLPIRTKKTKVQHQHIYFSVQGDGEAWGMQEKHDLGFWKDLSVLPILSSVIGNSNAFKTKGKIMYRTQHLLSHRKLFLYFVVGEEALNAGQTKRWTPKDLHEKAVPKPIAKFINEKLLNLE